MRYVIALVWIIISAPTDLGSQIFNRSNLPIVIIDTEGLQIFDEPKINATIRILDDEDGENIFIQEEAKFEGRIGIELRGQSSLQLFPKKGYGIEIRDADGNDLDTTILGMPAGSDWVIHSPYSDKSLIRNALAYQLAGQIMDYAPRVRLAELVINGEYLGVILWTEKIKRGKDRVDISKLKADENEGDDLTGGYIVKFDKGENHEVAWTSSFRPIPGQTQNTRFLYHYPKESVITDQQTQYIRDYITSFENVLMSDGFDDPVNGFRKYADASTFIQLFIINEISRNVDGYRLSTYMYKDKDSKGGLLKMGPVWDYNLAFGNADYCSGSAISGWAYNFNTVCPQDFWVNHVWWLRLLEDQRFRQELKDTWRELRATTFTDEALLGLIDDMTSQLNQAQQRNFQKWRVLGSYVWPNNFVGSSYASEVIYLKDWLIGRVAWLDDNFRALTTAVEDIEKKETLVYPNPSSDIITFDFSNFDTRPEVIEIYNQLGQLILRKEIKSVAMDVSLHQWSAQTLYYRLISSDKIIEYNQVQIIN